MRSSKLVVSHLQYEDDNIVLEVSTIVKFWSIKVILRGLKMAYGIKVNFFKTSLVKVNVDPVFLDYAGDLSTIRLKLFPLST